MRPFARRNRADADAYAAELEDFARRGATGFRRRLLVVSLVAVAAVVAVAALLAIHQYRNAKQATRTELRTRAAITAALVNVAITGDLSALQTVAASPAFATLDRARMRAYLERVASAPGNPFNSGYGWVDLDGVAQISTAASNGPPVNVADRTYFRKVRASDAPYVSGGLIGRRGGQALVVVAVPTRVNGRISGVLVGSIEVRTVSRGKAELQLGVQGLQIIDGTGKELLSGLTRVRNRALLARMHRTSNGIVSGWRGLDDRGNDVVAYAAIPTAHWWIAIDRPVSVVDAAARRSLYLELASLAAAALLVLGMVWIVVRRDRRERETLAARASASNVLSRALAVASTQNAVSDALLGALVAVFPDSLALVGFDTIDGRRIRISETPAYAWIRGCPELLDAIVRHAMAQRQTLVPQRVPDLAPHLTGARRLPLLDCKPIRLIEGEPLGGIALVRHEHRSLDENDWALLGSFQAQAAQAFDRTLKAAQERDLAMRLQRSLLPEALPESAGLRFAGHYRAGGEGVEVGGDWYDAVRRPDGIFHLSVGDVMGRGVNAAALMGRYRNAFRAYAYDCVSPGEIVRRLVRHADGEETMVTLACVSLDLYSGEIAYSCAGHPPPLLVIGNTGTATRLDDASAPPLGVATASSIREARRGFDEAATLVLYSDGLIERRGLDIDEGIDALGRAISGAPTASLEETLDRVTAELGAPSDDVALLIARITGEPTPFDVAFPSVPSMLPSVRRRLRAWLAHRHVAAAAADAVLVAVGEACNNAVEHAYSHDQGSVYVSVDEDGSTLRATIRDEGAWRDRRTNGDRGRGILIMEGLMNLAEIRPTRNGTIVVLERELGHLNGALSAQG